MGVSFARLKRYVRKHWRLIATWGFAGAFFFGGVSFLWAASLRIPDLQSLENRKIEQSVKIYDRTGEVLLSDLNEDFARTIVPLEEISDNIKKAIIAIEDPAFYKHSGVQPRAIARAIYTNLTQGDLLSGQGGSTITQQVIKLSVLTTDKSITRKLKEWVLALKIERVLAKDQIFELYLNQVPMGGNMYGVEEASQTFFNKDASDLSLPEAAYLAALLPAPTRLSPYRRSEETGRNERLEVRKNIVWDKLYEHGYISAEERDAGKSALVEFQPERENSIKAPHFVFYVQQYLEEKYGEDTIEEGGWKVITTLDADLQAKAEEIILKGALENTTRFNASNAAMVAIDPKTGDILSMVGSRNYFDTEIPGAYNVTVMKPGRQPGSAFKPFAYAEAFNKGYTPDTVVFDVKTQFSTACAPTNYTSGGDCYSPNNYDNNFRGPMALRNALAESINVPAVKVLYLAGLRDTLALARQMGITTLEDPSRYGLTLVLGGGEVTLLDITSAYGVFAQDGVRYEPVSILRIEDANGEIIEDNTERHGTQVLPRETAQKINDVLSDVAAREPLGVNATLSFPGYDVAFKTGTTNNYRDAWTIGYTPNIVVGMWAGNNDNTEMEKRVSGLIVGPMWGQVMRYALESRDNEPFSQSSYSQPSKPVLAGQWQIPGSDGLPHEILYWVDTDNPTGPPPNNPARDPQYVYWETPVQAWFSQYGFGAPQENPDAQNATSSESLPQEVPHN